MADGFPRRHPTLLTHFPGHYPTVALASYIVVRPVDAWYGVTGTGTDAWVPPSVVTATLYQGAGSGSLVGMPVAISVALADFRSPVLMVPALDGVAYAWVEVKETKNASYAQRQVRISLPASTLVATFPTLSVTVQQPGCYQSSCPVVVEGADWPPNNTVTFESVNPGSASTSSTGTFSFTAVMPASGAFMITATDATLGHEWFVSISPNFAVPGGTISALRSVPAPVARRTETTDTRTPAPTPSTSSPARIVPSATRTAIMTAATPPLALTATATVTSTMPARSIPGGTPTVAATPAP